MAGIILGQGATILGSCLAGEGYGTALEIGLYTNNHTPAWADTNSNYAECVDVDYTPFNEPYSSWTISTSSIPPTTVTGLPALFTFSGSPSIIIYGYFIRDQTSGTIMAAERFGSPYTVPSGVSNYVVVPLWNILDS